MSIKIIIYNKYILYNYLLLIFKDKLPTKYSQGNQHNCHNWYITFKHRNKCFGHFYFNPKSYEIFLHTNLEILHTVTEIFFVIHFSNIIQKQIFKKSIVFVQNVCNYGPFCSWMSWRIKKNEYVKNTMVTGSSRDIG